MKARGVHPALVEALLCEVRQGQLHFQVPGTSRITRGVKQGRGVCQGSPASPRLWVVGLDFLLRDLAQSLCERVVGFKLEGWEKEAQPIAIYADDEVLLASGMIQANRMLQEIGTALGRGGLEVEPGKCRFIANRWTPRTPHYHLRASGGPSRRTPKARWSFWAPN